MFILVNVNTKVQRGDEQRSHSCYTKHFRKKDRARSGKTVLPVNKHSRILSRSLASWPCSGFAAPDRSGSSPIEDVYSPGKPAIYSRLGR